MRLSTFLFFIGMDVFALLFTLFCAEIVLYSHNLGFLGTIFALGSGLFSGLIFLGIIITLIGMIFRGQITFFHRKERDLDLSGEEK